MSVVSQIFTGRASRFWTATRSALCPRTAAALDTGAGHDPHDEHLRGADHDDAVVLRGSKG